MIIYLLVMRVISKKCTPLVSGYFYAGYVIVMRSADKNKFKKVARSDVTSVTISDKLKADVEYFFR